MAPPIWGGCTVANLPLGAQPRNNLRLNVMLWRPIHHRVCIANASVTVGDANCYRETGSGSSNDPVHDRDLVPTLPHCAESLMEDSTATPSGSSATRGGSLAARPDHQGRGTSTGSSIPPGSNSVQLQRPRRQLPTRTAAAIREPHSLPRQISNWEFEQSTTLGFPEETWEPH
jgi:hypothetical protein